MTGPWNEEHDTAYAMGVLSFASAVAKAAEVPFSEDSDPDDVTEAVGKMRRERNQLRAALADLLADPSDTDAAGRARALLVEQSHRCEGLSCPCSFPTYAELAGELRKAEGRIQRLFETILRAGIDPDEGQ